jgi:hypothetical protein
VSLLCPSGKVRHSSPTNAKAAAHIFARQLNEQGKIAEAIYGYRCPQCRGGWHLTRREEWESRPNRLLCPQAPLELQRWAITGVIELPPQTG